MLGLRLDADTETGLTRVARRQGRTKSEVARDALREYLRREDRDDALLAEVRLIAKSTADEDLNHLDAVNDELTDLIEAEERSFAVRRAR